MISVLSGKVKALEGQCLILDIGGVGFSVMIPDRHCFAINENIDLQIYFYFNQESGPQLYGFANKTAKDVFGLILSCSGLGPKLGLSILSQISPEKFIQLIVVGDAKSLSSLNGIGPKKAELMIMHLKDKVKKIELPHTSIEAATVIKLREIAEALSSLNYSKQEVATAIAHVKNSVSLDRPFDEILKKALSFLSR